MTAFLKDITPFLGENRKNEEGQTLEQFLEAYDPNRYENPSLTADIMVVQAEEEKLKILLIRRKNHPSIGWWALPGGFVNQREDAIDAAKRELFEETGLTGIEVEEFGVWSDYKRDPRTRIVTITYLAYLTQEVLAEAGDDAADADWFTVSFYKSGERKEKERNIETYELKLTGERTNKKVVSVVEYSYTPNAVIKNEKYKVISTTELAFDHPAAIVKGLLYLQERLKNINNY